MSNVIAQDEALAFGKMSEEIMDAPDWQIPDRTFEGNRPSTTIIADKLTPKTLGKLVAFYEQSVFTQGVIWGIDYFEQWEVELGKALAQRIVRQLTGDEKLEHDSSTNALICYFRSIIPKKER